MNATNFEAYKAKVQSSVMENNACMRHRQGQATEIQRFFQTLVDVRNTMNQSEKEANDAKRGATVLSFLSDLRMA